MPAPTIYRSSDANAPVLIGGVGSLTSLLDACLVNGYGSAFASGTITSDATIPSDGDTVTVGSLVYTFRTTIGSTPYNVALGANAAASLTSLAQAINANGTAGTAYAVGTLAHPDVYASAVTATVVTVTARKGGAAGNSIALAEASTHLSVSGAALTGGGGSDSKASVGWTKPFSGAVGQAVYRQAGSANRMYLQVDDSGAATGLGRDAVTFGFETMSAWNTGTGQFPTVAQNAVGVVVRKSASSDTGARTWIMLADDRTFYLLVLTLDQAGNYVGCGFGDIVSLVSGDLYKCCIVGQQSSSASAMSSGTFGQALAASSGAQHGGHWLPRNYSGVGGSTSFIKVQDAGLGNSGAPSQLIGSLGVPNPADGGLYVAPIRVVDASLPGTTISGTMDLRGRMRGLWHVAHQVSGFADGDTFSGVGEYAGRSFLIVKFLLGSSPSVAMIAIETTAWDS